MFFPLFPMMLVLALVVLSTLLYALELPYLTPEMLPPRVSAGLFVVLVLWMFGGMARQTLRDTEQREAEKQARDNLLREQNFELWAARQLHDTAVRERTAEGCRPCGAVCCMSVSGQ